MPPTRKTATPPTPPPGLEEGDDGLEATIGTGPATPAATVPAPAPQAPAKRPERTERGAPPESDRVGMLAHLVEHWSAQDRPAQYTVAWAGAGDEVKVTFTYPQEVKGKWTTVTKSAIGMNIDDAA